ncbi:MAG: 30S ribosomal protein S8, partial [Nitrospira sp.]
HEELKPVRGGLGVSILSTSKGLMTDQESKRSKLGGELLCQVW